VKHFTGGREKKERSKAMLKANKKTGGNLI
jgi:hypothetical protein